MIAHNNNPPLFDRERELLLAEAHAHLTNPCDDQGRTAVELALTFPRGTQITPAPRCVECRQRLILVRQFDGNDRVPPRAAYLRHPGKSNCTGGVMTPWHVAMQKAAAGLGFTVEETISVGRSTRRLDAYHAATNRVVEFVHSLSSSYPRKQMQLASLDYDVSWIFDSAGGFAGFKNSWRERPSIEHARQGLFVVERMFPSDDARGLIDKLGRHRCYVWYRGLVMACVGRDVWQCLPPDHPLQQMASEANTGFNIELRKIHLTHRADGSPRTVRCRFDLPDTSEVDPGELLKPNNLWRDYHDRFIDPVEVEAFGEFVGRKQPSGEPAAAACDASPPDRVRNNFTSREAAEYIATTAKQGVAVATWSDERPTDVVVANQPSVGGLAEWADEPEAAEDPQPEEPEESPWGSLSGELVWGADMDETGTISPAAKLLGDSSLKAVRAASRVGLTVTGIPVTILEVGVNSGKVDPKLFVTFKLPTGGNETTGIFSGYSQRGRLESLSAVTGISTEDLLAGRNLGKARGVKAVVEYGRLSASGYCSAKLFHPAPQLPRDAAAGATCSG